MAATLYNGWYVAAPNDHDVGPSSGTPSAYQQTNATNIFNALSALGWTVNAIAAAIGNMQLESYLNPACVYPHSTYPQSINSLADLDNSIAINVPQTEAMGLVQWRGYGNTPPIGNQIVSYAIRYGYQWYDGEIQMKRLSWEYTDNKKWKTKTIDGVSWTWQTFVSSTQSAEYLANIWMRCYEVTNSRLPERRSNSAYWYNYFKDTPQPTPTPAGWISGAEFSNLAAAYDPAITGVQIPYTQMDCFGYVQTVWRDIQAVGPSGKLVDTSQPPLQNGTNSLWRENVSPYPNYTFNTTSPDNQNPTPVLWYKDTISNCISRFGEIPAGALLFHQISEAGPPAIPPQYAGDGIGNFAHVGIYIGNSQVMQSGGRDSSSVPGGGVHRSAYDSSAWNYVAFVVWVDCYSDQPGPEPPGPGPGDVPHWLFSWYTNNKKGVTKRVIRTI